MIKQKNSRGKERIQTRIDKPIYKSKKIVRGSLKFLSTLRFYHTKKFTCIRFFRNLDSLIEKNKKHFVQIVQIYKKRLSITQQKYLVRKTNLYAPMRNTSKYIEIESNTYDTKNRQETLDRVVVKSRLLFFSKVSKNSEKN